MPTSHRAGTATIVALHDGTGPFFRPRQDAFPAATPALWRSADTRDPGAVQDGGWLLRYRCFALRFDDGRTILVDVGIGPAGAPASTWAPTPGRLPEELTAAGIPPAEVDTVVLTHVHADHVGWAVDGDAGTPYFRNARYVLQRAEVAALEGALVTWLLDPLRAAGQLSIVDGNVDLGRGVRVVVTPGHTPGHQSVLVEAANGPVLVAGDLLVHAVQLVDPATPYAYEADPNLARASRVAWLAHLEARDGILATAHLTEPFVPVRRKPGR
jgi:glyoxylase-like metal-dependent hydrolase (beta-lactamase superfamily II)